MVFSDFKISHDSAMLPFQASVMPQHQRTMRFCVCKRQYDLHEAHFFIAINRLYEKNCLFLQWACLMDRRLLPRRACCKHAIALRMKLLKLK